MFDSVAVLGATGAVGTIILELFEKRSFAAKSFKFIASKRSAGKTLRFRGTDHVIEESRPEAFEGVDLLIASTPDDVALELLPEAVKRGCVVVDESAAYRMDPAVPLVVPEVNPQAAFEHKGIIASPNCSTTQMVVAMKPLHDRSPIKRVIVSTYQATSGAGLAGSRDLEAGTKACLAGAAHDYESFAHPIAFNCIPQIGSPKQMGYTSEEMKMVHETHKIFGDDTIKVCPTCVRVPVSNCHSESILIETEEKIGVEEARSLFAATPGIVVMDDIDGKLYPMPINCDTRDEVFVGRIREDLSSPTGLTFWCVSDNLRKGAATNAVQIAELLQQSKPTSVA